MHLRHLRVIALLLLLIIAACGEERPASRPDENKVIVSEDTNPKPVSLRTDWATFMRDISYSGVSQDAVLRPPLDLVWKFKTGGPVDSSPVVANGIVYIGSDDYKLYALNAREWGVKWFFEAGGRIIYAPTVYAGTVYFSARDNKVYALDANTGAKKWEFQADGWINAPVVAFQKKIYLGCYDNKIYTLDAATGKQEALDFAVVIIGRQRFVCSDGEFFPLDARQRAYTWRKDIPPSESWPARANGVVYIGARDSKLRAFDYPSRQEIWHYTAGGWVDSSPAVADGMLYFGSRDGYVYAFANAQSQQVAEQTYDREGAVIRNDVGIYDRLDEKAEIIARLNEGRELPIIGVESDVWYQIALPDGRKGWISAADFVPVKWLEGLQINDTLVKDTKPVVFPRKAEEASWSPDGLTLTFFDNISVQHVYWMAKSIWLADGDGASPVWIADGSFYNPKISWSLNSDWLALENVTGTNREVWAVRTNGTGLRKIADGEAPALSPRGGKIAFIRRDKISREIWVRDLRNDSEEKLLDVGIQGEESHATYSYIPILNSPAWSPGGSRLAAGIDGYHYRDRYSRVLVVDSSGEIIKSIAVRAERIENIQWSPDNSYLAYITQGHMDRPVIDYLGRQAHVTNLNGQGKEQIFENCEAIAWSPDGKYLALVVENNCMGMQRKVLLLDMESQRLNQLLASREKIYDVFWLADGKRIALLASSNPSETAARTRGWIVSVELPG